MRACSCARSALCACLCVFLLCARECVCLSMHVHGRSQYREELLHDLADKDQRAVALVVHNIKRLKPGQLKHTRTTIVKIGGKERHNVWAVAVQSNYQKERKKTKVKEKAKPTSASLSLIVPPLHENQLYALQIVS